MNRLDQRWSGRRSPSPSAPPKQKARYSKVIVAAVILMNAAFAAAVLFIFYKNSVEPTALIAAWFAFTTGELWALAMLKRGETKKEEEITHEED